MHIFFVDDSIQKKPSRPKMGTMVGVGGVVVESGHVKALEDELDRLCKSYGFPPGEVFKWSPCNEHWMRNRLGKEKRKEFLIDVVGCLAKHECKVVFIAEDKNCTPAAKSRTHEIDVVKLLIERVDWYFSQIKSYGLIIADRPGGDYKKEEDFLLECFETLKEGTDFRKPSKIAMSILTSPYRLSRILQAADLVVSCTMSYVCGETKYSPIVFEHLKPLYLVQAGRVGGVGVKLHPFIKYGNLYHWLFGDTHYWHGSSGRKLPIKGQGFSGSLDEY